MSNLYENRYEQSKGYANNIISTADEMNDTFTRMNDIMTQLSEDWKSKGASEVIEMYNNIKAKYPIYCAKIKDYAKTIITDVDNYQSSDTTVSKMVDNA